VGVLVALTGIGLGVLGGGGLWLESRRDAAGFVSTNTRLLSTGTAAITAEDIDLRLDPGTAAWVSSNRFGTIRVRAADASGGPIFIGVAPQAALDAWLGPVAHDQVSSIVAGQVSYRHQGGVANAPSPAGQTFWSASVSGTGTQELRWPVQSGRWAIVLARPDGTPPVQARVDIGASIPGLTGPAIGLLVAGVVLLVGGIVLVAVGAAGLARATPAAPGRGAYPTLPAPPAPRGATPEESAPQQEPMSGGQP
jgi:hypothetical protein